MRYLNLLLLLLFILTANGYLPGGCGTTTRHNTQHTNNIHHTSHKITQRSNETQYRKLHTHNKHPTQNENTTITTTII
jgi:hypothetical protein